MVTLYQLYKAGNGLKNGIIFLCKPTAEKCYLGITLMVVQPTGSTFIAAFEVVVVTVAAVGAVAKAI